APRPLRVSGGQAAGARPVAQAAAPGALDAYPDFAAVLDLIREKRDMHLLVEAETGIRLVSYSPGRIEFTPAPGAARDLASKLGTRLQQWTGARWAVSVSNAGGAPSLAETRLSEKEEALLRARTHPGIAAVLSALPQARLVEILPPVRPEEAAAAEALPGIEEVDEDWDPFEDD
ncbi:DNA polymerase III subunit gamma/tau, partial [Mangrovicoccus sp. HB182678]|nr:DNA polymerase III subunit gamma/tau [Mangrovicoccus algicola]